MAAPAVYDPVEVLTARVVAAVLSGRHSEARTLLRTARRAVATDAAGCITQMIVHWADADDGFPRADARRPRNDDRNLISVIPPWTYPASRV